MTLRIFISTVFITLTVFTVQSQTEEKTRTIYSKVKQINNYNNYTVKQLLNDYYVDIKNIASDNGQELKGYYKNGQLKKIVFSVGISCCMNTYEYYFADGNLIFIYEKQDVYKAVTDNNEGFKGWDYTKLEPAFEGCYYFDKHKIIKEEKSGNKMFEEDINKKEKFLRDIQEHIQDLSNAE